MDGRILHIEWRSFIFWDGAGYNICVCAQKHLMAGSIVYVLSVMHALRRCDRRMQVLGYADTEKEAAARPAREAALAERNAAKAAAAAAMASLGQSAGGSQATPA